jgi:hypothetical protein
MGSFECYCALCSGPLGIYSIKLGSSKARHIARRKKRVENKRRRLLGEDVMDEESNEWEEAEKKEDELAKATEDDKDKEMKDAATTETENDNEERENPDEEGEGAMEVEEEIEGEWQENWDDDGQGSVEDYESEQESEYDEDDSNEEEIIEVAPTIGENEDFSDNASQASELGLQSDFDLADGAEDDTESMFDCNERNSYDPTIITQEDVQWVDRSRALAINRGWKGEKKAFLSGRGRYEDYVSGS